MRTLNDRERLNWLQLIRTDSIGPITFHRLLKKFGSAGAALAALPEISSKAGRKKPLRAADRDAALNELNRAESAGARLVAFGEPDYPPMLAAIPDPPPVFYLCGHASLFEKQAVGIVGARNASAAGRKLARQLAADLSAASVCVVSGLARGIDGAAHEAALAGGTIAVVAGGVDVIYPPEHEELTRAIAAQGAVMSERPPGAQPTARDFPRRNRLISGLSFGVVVVEAAERSGTLITARFALEQGREVFAVPGSPLDPRCQGANRLIRDGATLVQSAQDILDVMAAQQRGMAANGATDLFDWAADDDSVPSADFADIRRAVRDALSYTPLHRDEVLRDVDAPPGVIVDALLDLVLAGEAEEQSGGMFVLASD
ncbi:MAG: DNA-processing protein DprA [Pseudomonadota bacterium]